MSEIHTKIGNKLSRKFEILHNEGNYSWVSKAQNGQVTGRSVRKFSRRIDTVANAQRHGMDDNPNGLGLDDSWEISRTSNGYYWSRTSMNGTTVGKSKRFTRRIDCERNAKSFGYAV